MRKLGWLLLCCLAAAARAWYDTTTPRHAIWEAAEQGEEHAPRRGTQTLERRQRTDDQSVHLLGAVRFRQARSEHERQRILEHYHNPPIIGTVEPHGGPTTGGTEVNVTGTNLAGGDLYRCKFGDTVVSAHFDDYTSTIGCVAPKRDGGGESVKFSVAIFFYAADKTHHVASHARLFRYYDPMAETPRVFSLSPTSGPVQGGTTVTVVGLHMAGRSSYVCVFGGKPVPAVHMHAKHGLEETLVCTAPPHRTAESVEFTVRIAGTDLRAKSLAFTYYDPPRPADMRPAEGPMVGGTLVQVRGAGFADLPSQSWQCRFGGHVVVEGTWDASASSLKCLAPPEAALPSSRGPSALAEGGELYLGNGTWTRQVLLQLAQQEHAPALARRARHRVAAASLRHLADARKAGVAAPESALLELWQRAGLVDRRLALRAAQRGRSAGGAALEPGGEGGPDLSAGRVRGAAATLATATAPSDAMAHADAALAAFYGPGGGGNASAAGAGDGSAGSSAPPQGAVARERAAIEGRLNARLRQLSDPSARFGRSPFSPYENETDLVRREVMHVLGGEAGANATNDRPPVAWRVDDAHRRLYADVESSLASVLDQARGQDFADGTTAAEVMEWVVHDVAVVVGNLTRAIVGQPPLRETLVFNRSREGSEVFEASTLPLCGALVHLADTTCAASRGPAPSAPRRRGSPQSPHELLHYTCRVTSSLVDAARCNRTVQRRRMPALHARSLHPHAHFLRQDVRQFERVPPPPPRVTLHAREINALGDLRISWGQPQVRRPGRGDRVCAYSLDSGGPALVGDVGAAQYGSSGILVECVERPRGAAWRGANESRLAASLRQPGHYVLRYELRDAPGEGCAWERRAGVVGMTHLVRTAPVCVPPRVRFAVKQHCDGVPPPPGEANTSISWSGSGRFEERASESDRVCLYTAPAGGGGRTPERALARSYLATLADATGGIGLPPSFVRGSRYVVRYEAVGEEGECRWDRDPREVWGQAAFTICEVLPLPHVELTTSCEGDRVELRWRANTEAEVYSSPDDRLCLFQYPRSPGLAGNASLHSQVSTGNASALPGRQPPSKAQWRSQPVMRTAYRASDGEPVPGGHRILLPRSWPHGVDFVARYQHVRRGAPDGAGTDQEACAWSLPTVTARVKQAAAVWGSHEFPYCTEPAPRARLGAVVRGMAVNVTVRPAGSFRHHANAHDLLCVYDVTGRAPRLQDSGPALPSLADSPALALPRRTEVRTDPLENGTSLARRVAARFNVSAASTRLYIGPTGALRLHTHSRMGDFGVALPDQRVTVTLGQWKPFHTYAVRYEHRVRGGEPCSWDDSGVTRDPDLRRLLDDTGAASAYAPLRSRSASERQQRRRAGARSAVLWGSHAFTVGAPSQGDAVKVRFQLRHDPDLHATHVAWLGATARYYRHKGLHDLICFWERDPAAGGVLRYVDGYVERLYWADRLRLPDQFEPGRAYVVRYEHREDDRYGCSLHPDDAHLIWGEREFTLREGAVPLPLYAGTPPVGTVVEVSANGQDWHPVPRRFTFHDPWYHNARHRADPANTVSFRPASGPVRGGTLVTVWGLPVNLPPAYGGEAPYRCVFGAREVPAVFQAPWHHQILTRDERAARTVARVAPPAVLCYSPPARGGVPGGVDFRVKVGDVEVANFTLPASGRFTYYSPPGVEEVTPASGTCDAEVVVRLTLPPPGDAALTVRFGSGAAALCVHNGAENAIRCRAPPLAPGRAGVEISPNGQHFSASGKGFVAFDPPHVYNVVPRRGPAKGGEHVKVSVFFLRAQPQHGPTEGGSEVAISGRGLAGGSNYKCRFGQVVVPGFFSADEGEDAARLGAGARHPPRAPGPHGGASAGRHGVLRCRAPPHPRPATVPIAVSLDGVSFTATDACALRFTYYRSPAPTELRMTPTHGPSVGGTLVAVRGPGLLFAGTSSLIGLHHRCRFTNSITGAVIATMRGVYDAGEGALKCVTPAHRAGRVHLSVSWNGQDFVRVRGNGAPRVPAEAAPASAGGDAGSSSSSSSRGGGTLASWLSPSSLVELRGANASEGADPTTRVVRAVMAHGDRLREAARLSEHDLPASRKGDALYQALSCARRLVEDATDRAAAADTATRLVTEAEAEHDLVRELGALAASSQRPAHAVSCGLFLTGELVGIDSLVRRVRTALGEVPSHTGKVLGPEEEAEEGAVPGGTWVDGPGKGEAMGRAAGALLAGAEDGVEMLSALEALRRDGLADAGRVLGHVARAVSASSRPSEVLTDLAALFGVAGTVGEQARALREVGGSGALLRAAAAAVADSEQPRVGLAALSTVLRGDGRARVDEAVAVLLHDGTDTARMHRALRRLLGACAGQTGPPLRKLRCRVARKAEKRAFSRLKPHQRRVHVRETDVLRSRGGGNGDSGGGDSTASSTALGAGEGFLFYDPYEDTSFQPVSGPVSGGTMVTVMGAGADSPESWVCHFGPSHQSRLERVAPGVAQCVAPHAAAGAGDVVFAVAPKDAAIPSLDSLPAIRDPFSRQPGGSAEAWDRYMEAALRGAGAHGDAEGEGSQADWFKPMRNTTAGSADQAAALLETGAWPSRRSSHTVPGVSFGLQPPVFSYHNPLGPLALSPAGGPAQGGTELHIMGANFTAEAAYTVRIGNATTAGLYDVGRGLLLAQSPPVAAGVYNVSVSRNGQQEVAVPGRFVVHHTPRLSVQAVAGGPGDRSGGSGSGSGSGSDGDDPAAEDVAPGEIDTGPVEILYSPWVDDTYAVRKVSISVEDGPLEREVEMMAVVPADAYGRFEWRYVHPPSKFRQLRVRAVTVVYGGPENATTLATELQPVRARDPHEIVDDNSGMGWLFHFVPRAGVDADAGAGAEASGGQSRAGDWLEVPASAFRNGALWNEAGSIKVAFRMAGWNATVDGKYRHRDGAVVAKTPATADGDVSREEGEGMPLETMHPGEHDATVEVALNGEQWTRDGTALYAFDGRYAAGGVNGTMMRLVPETLARANQSIPTTVVGRALFDRRVVFDLSQSLGVSRDRLVVTAADPETGVAGVECIPSRLLADPTCVDLMAALRALREEHGSVLYDGVVTWALDPLFPKGEVVIVDGKPHVRGRCSAPIWQTEEDCLRDGFCSCPMMDDNRDKCLSSQTATGRSCLWTPRNTWTRRLTPLKFGSCSNPKLRTKEACLEKGKCSDPRLKTRDECLAKGVCVGRPGLDPDFDYSAIKDRKACENPALRAGTSGKPMPRCHPRPGDSSSFDFSSITTREECENPGSRPAAKAPLQGGGGRCVKAPSSPPATSPFTYAQFRSKDQCEVPETRFFVRGACEMMVAERRDSHVMGGLMKYGKPMNPGGKCYSRTDVTTYPRNFACDVFLTPEECEDPQARKRRCESVQNRKTPSHCPRPDGDLWGNDDDPDLMTPFGDKGVEAKYGPPCRWNNRAEPNGRGKGRGGAPGSENFDDGEINCGPGPQGKWMPGKSPPPIDPADLAGPPGVWGPPEGPDGGGGGPPGGGGGDQGPPGKWEPANDFSPDNDWEDGPEDEDPCPCQLGQTKYHLTKCNWQTCGPPAQAPKSSVHEIERLKMWDEMVTEYQAYVSVGGKELWMTLDTGTSTTWVMSAACFLMGCTQTPMFMGMFIPMVPPALVDIDKFKAGLVQEGTMKGFLGHSMVTVAGTPVIGAPIAMGILDKGFTIGKMSFNHSGAVGLGLWEENMPKWITLKDPALAILDFARCGNVFYPVPATPAMIPKPFQMWGIPFFFPTALTLQYSLYFGDTGGCFYLGGKSSSQGMESFVGRSGPRWVMAIPIGVKMAAPSFMFLLSDVKVNGISVTPCMLGSCRAAIHSGQFSVSGPLTPMLRLLEWASAPKTCEHMEDMPDVEFNIMGSSFSMTRQEYVIYGNQYGTTECLSAFTPDAQLIPGFDMWILGDAFIRAFPATFSILPLRRVGLQVADHRYYEKHGCTAGAGKGPLRNGEKPETTQKQGQEAAERKDLDTRMQSDVDDIGWKRLFNWNRDRAGQFPKPDPDFPGGMCQSGMAFREGACVPADFEPQVDELKRMHERRRRRLAKGLPVLTHEDLFEDDDDEDEGDGDGDLVGSGGAGAGAGGGASAERFRGGGELHGAQGEGAGSAGAAGGPGNVDAALARRISEARRAAGMPSEEPSSLADTLDRRSKEEAGVPTDSGAHGRPGSYADWSAKLSNVLGSDLEDEAREKSRRIAEELTSSEAQGGGGGSGGGAAGLSDAVAALSRAEEAASSGPKTWEEASARSREASARDPGAVAARHARARAAAGAPESLSAEVMGDDDAALEAILPTSMLEEGGAGDGGKAEARRRARARVQGRAGRRLLGVEKQEGVSAPSASASEGKGGDGSGDDGAGTEPSAATGAAAVAAGTLERQRRDEMRRQSAQATVMEGGFAQALDADAELGYPQVNRTEEEAAYEVELSQLHNGDVEIDAMLEQHADAMFKAREEAGSGKLAVGKDTRAGARASFQQNKDAVMSRLHRRERDALRDRLARGVDVTSLARWQRGAEARFAETEAGAGVEATVGVTLSPEPVRDVESDIELHRNMSVMLRSMLPKVNVSTDALRGWWRGESEEFVHRETEALMLEWEESMDAARRAAKSFKVKNMVNKRLLRRYIERITLPDQVDDAYDTAVDRIEGTDYNAYDKRLRKEEGETKQVRRRELKEEWKARKGTAPPEWAVEENHKVDERERREILGETSSVREMIKQEEQEQKQKQKQKGSAPHRGGSGEAKEEEEEEDAAEPYSEGQSLGSNSAAANASDAPRTPARNDSQLVPPTYSNAEALSSGAGPEDGPLVEGSRGEAAHVGSGTATADGGGGGNAAGAKAQPRPEASAGRMKFQVKGSNVTVPADDKFWRRQALKRRLWRSKTSLRGTKPCKDCDSVAATGGTASEGSDSDSVSHGGPTAREQVVLSRTVGGGRAPQTQRLVRGLNNEVISEIVDDDDDGDDGDGDDGDDGEEEDEEEDEGGDRDGGWGDERSARGRGRNSRSSNRGRDDDPFAARDGIPASPEARWRALRERERRMRAHGAYEDEDAEGEEEDEEGEGMRSRRRRHWLDDVESSDPHRPFSHEEVVKARELRALKQSGAASRAPPGAREARDGQRVGRKVMEEYQRMVEEHERLHRHASRQINEAQRALEHHRQSRRPLTAHERAFLKKYPFPGAPYAPNVASGEEEEEEEDGVGGHGDSAGAPSSVEQERRVRAREEAKRRSRPIRSESAEGGAQGNGEWQQDRGASGRGDDPKTDGVASSARTAGMGPDEDEDEDELLGEMTFSAVMR